MNGETSDATAPEPVVAGASLDDLVARTAGPQPWRKAFHACNAAAVAALLAILAPTRGTAVVALGAMVLAAFAVDALRLTTPAANALFFRVFGKFASPREAKGIASSTWYAAGIFLVVALFPRDVAITAVLVLGLCDPAAAVLGRRFGRRPFLGGTLEGTVAFFAVCAVIIVLRHTWPAALVASAAAALAERRSWPLDDNLTVPVVCASVIQAIASIT